MLRERNGCEGDYVPTDFTNITKIKRSIIIISCGVICLHTSDNNMPRDVFPL